MKDRPNVLLALILIVVGIVLLLNNLGYTEINLLAYWPLLIIIYGLHSLFLGSRNAGAVVFSVFLIVLGAVLQARSLGILTINIGKMMEIFFPLFLIAIGISLFAGKSHTGRGTTAFLGGVERGKNEAWQLESEAYFAFLGGIDLDLTSAVLPEGETVLDLTAVMGGIDVRVPADLPVSADGFAILGGVELFGKGGGGIIGSTRNEQNITEGQNRLLKIQARAILGGIDVKRI
ncbi:MAG: cell wall-active antibiotics response protein [Firmicutes bacterium]|nr:cell wall-active antibiotics response protein [Bacillota bacterium]